MENLVSISTGLVYKFITDRNEMIRKLRQFSPDGIELSFAAPEYLFNFSVTADNRAYLRSLPYVTIHAPWKTVVYGPRGNGRSVVAAIEKLYLEINAKNVTVHASEVQDFEIFHLPRCQWSVENDDWRKGANRLEQIEVILRRYPWLKFTFDFAHALTISEDEPKAYLEKLRPRMSQIHLSYFDRKLKDHHFLSRHRNVQIDSLTKLAATAGKPLVLECVAETEEEIPLVTQEIQYVKRLDAGRQYQRTYD